MIIRIVAFSFLMSVSVFAADDCTQSTVDPNVIRSLTSVSSRLKTECPNQINVENFCAAVEAQTLEPDPRHDLAFYRYHTLVFDASCVEPGDSEATIKAKVQVFWNKYHDTLLCDRFNFQPRFGNILKLSVARGSDPFIADAINNWGVNLNHVDAADNGTVLDYIEKKKRDAGSNQVILRKLQNYYDQFRAAGAKHKREL